MRLTCTAICLLAMVMAKSITAAEPSTASAVVTPTEARFVLPVPEREVWNWNRESTADNELEYMWSVEVPAGDNKTLSAAFNLFKFPGAAPASGSFEDLLKAGQTDLWLNDETGGELIPGHVRAHAVPGAIVITLSDPNTLRILMRDKPRQLEVQSMHAPDVGIEVSAVDVTYEDAPATQPAAP